MNYEALDRALKQQARKAFLTFLAFVRILLGVIGGIVVICIAYSLLTLPLFWARYESIRFDPSWQKVAPLYLCGMVAISFGLIVVRFSRLREEARGPVLPYGDDRSDRIGVGRWLLWWLPPIHDRSEKYLWAFTLITTLLTFFLRDQSLNWIISRYGFFDIRTVQWDIVSMVCAPLSAVVLTIRLLAHWRTVTH